MTNSEIEPFTAGEGSGLGLGETLQTRLNKVVSYEKKLILRSLSTH
jgi:hypothetical protein